MYVMYRCLTFRTDGGGGPMGPMGGLWCRAQRAYAEESDWPKLAALFWIVL